MEMNPLASLDAAERELWAALLNLPDLKSVVSEDEIRDTRVSIRSALGEVTRARAALQQHVAPDNVWFVACQRCGMQTARFLTHGQANALLDSHDPCLGCGNQGFRIGQVTGR